MTVYLSIISTVYVMIKRDWLYKVPQKEEQIADLGLNDFSKKGIAVEVYSSILNCNVVFCSDERVLADMQTSNPELVSYTASELKEIINLNPNAETLIAINNLKSVFPNSRVIDIIRSSGPC